MVCFSVGKNCFNTYESFGEICVGCGCCSTDSNKRNRARLELSKRMLEENENFSYWAPSDEVRKIQERNVKENIIYFKEEVDKYTKLVANRR